MSIVLAAHRQLLFSWCFVIAHVGFHLLACASPLDSSFGCFCLASLFGVQARQELQADFDTFITKLEKHFNTEELHLQSGVCHPLLFCC